MLFRNEENWSSKRSRSLSDAFWKVLDASRASPDGENAWWSVDDGDRDVMLGQWTFVNALLFFEGCWREAKMMRRKKQKREGKEKNSHGWVGCLIMYALVTRREGGTLRFGPFRAETEGTKEKAPYYR